MTDYCLVITTIAAEQKVAEIVEPLLEEKLAACIQVLPINSFYRWQGKVEQGAETLLLIKSRKSLYAKLQQRIQQLHVYEVPEIICLPIENGLPEYLDWISQETVSG